jgi:hypothetical protein
MSLPQSYLDHAAVISHFRSAKENAARVAILHIRSWVRNGISTWKLEVWRSEGKWTEASIVSGMALLHVLY